MFGVTFKGNTELDIGPRMKRVVNIHSGPHSIHREPVVIDTKSRDLSKFWPRARQQNYSAVITSNKTFNAMHTRERRVEPVSAAKLYSV